MRPNILTWILCCLFAACGPTDVAGDAGSSTIPRGNTGSSQSGDAGTAIVRDAGVADAGATTQQTISSIVIDAEGVSFSEFRYFDIKRDLSGSLHVVYSSAGHPRYGVCRAACTRPQSWSWLTLATENADWYLQMGVELSSGRVVLAWNDDVGLNVTTRVAECSSNCTAASSWAVGTIRTGITGGATHGRTLQIDALGRVHMLIDGSGVMYATCRSGCSIGANWSVRQIMPATAEQCALRVGGGRIGVACIDWGAVTYGECSANCTAVGAWSSVRVASDAVHLGHTMALTLDSTGARIAYIDSTMRSVAFSCTGTCGTASSWSGVAWPSIDATDVGTDLAVAGGIAWMANTHDDAVRVMRCARGGACWVPGDAWSPVATIETTAQALETNTSPVPACRAGATGFSELWDRLEPKVAIAPEGAFVLTKTSDFVGCEPDASTYVQLRYRLHLAFIPN